MTMKGQMCARASESIKCSKKRECHAVVEPWKTLARDEMGASFPCDASEWTSLEVGLGS